MSGNISKVRVSAKGWVVIPAPLRRKYGLEAGSTVEIVDGGGKIIIFPTMKDPIKEMRGKLAGGKSLVKALLEERAKDLQQRGY